MEKNSPDFNRESLFCPKCGHYISSYTGIVSEESATVFRADSAAPLAAKSAGWLSMKEAAKMMGYSYFWLSRMWRKLGLKPTIFGHKRRFAIKDIEDCLKRNCFTYRGRPPKQ